MQRGLASGLPRLAHLDLSCNCLTQLPPDFTALTALQHLDLQVGVWAWGTPGAARFSVFAIFYVIDRRR